MELFFKEQTERISEKKGTVSGNGSIMRNSPVPIAFNKDNKEDIKKAIKFAEL
jgi:ADP-ribosylglycohydrolase